MNHNLVSIIIPCYNKEKWLRQAIDSCLNQTYSDIEIIVVDDGSTDNSLEIIKNYGSKIIWSSDTNKGANYARNRGYALSSGTYIQYLDADDYLLPEKIERQVSYLQEIDADLVYGDMLVEKYSSDGLCYESEIKVCDTHEDILEFLLSFESFIQTASPLIKTEAIATSDGWDESLKAAQDIDFFLTLAINGAKFAYQSGANAVHRYYDSEQTISSNKHNLSKYRLLVIQKVESKLNVSGKLVTKYRKALASACFKTALFSCLYLDYSQYTILLRKTVSLYPSFAPDTSILKSGGSLYKILYNYLGFVWSGIIYRYIKTLSSYRYKKAN